MAVACPDMLGLWTGHWRQRPFPASQPDLRRFSDV